MGSDHSKIFFARGDASVALVGRMLRHTGALGYVLHSPRRLALRNRLHGLPPKLDPVALSDRSRHFSHPSPTVVFCHLHHDARRRRKSIAAMPIIPHALSFSVRDGTMKMWETGAVATAAIAVDGQRMTFSSSDPPPSGRRRYLTKEQSPPKSTAMDEGTRKSIRQSDEKDKKSMQMVKLALAGNLLITVAKFLAYLHSGSSAMSSEAMHSLVDSVNQLLLVVGLQTAAHAPDKQHQYGYGKSVYFWCLVSALGTFWLGAGISMRHSIEELINPTMALEKVGYEVWGVLGVSLLVDGFVLVKALRGIWATKPEGISFIKHLKKIRDPTTLAVLLEDSAACLGVLMAIVGMGMSQAYQNPVFDSIAGVSIAGLLGAMGLALIEMNRRFLIGQSVDSETTEGIKAILMSRGAIEQLHQVQSQWVGTHTFAFKAEVDFDGTYLAAKLKLNTRYSEEFRRLLQRNPNDETKYKDHDTLLSFYTEDVMRLAEREVREAETEIRKKYPEAAFIELEPDSSAHNMFAIEHFQTPALRKVEEKTMKQILANLVIAKASEDAALSSASAESRKRRPTVIKQTAPRGEGRDGERGPSSQ